MNLSPQRQTLEQLRAQDAWNCTEQALKVLGDEQAGKYKNFVKGVPALIINSGLMQVMAFCQDKGSKDSQRHVEVVAAQLRIWLHKRYSNTFKSAGFDEFMSSLMKAESADYQAITAEAFAWLRWLRQMAPARIKGD
jgi:CRISPR-associated protein Cmr5